jgi:hypothetical protein
VRATSSYLVVLMLLFGSAGPAEAQDQPESGAADAATESCAWNPRWSRFTVGESIATGSASLGLLVARLALRSPESARWTAPILLDTPTRNHLRGSTESARDTMADVSDGLLYALLAMPFVDAAIAWGVHGAPEVAAEMTAMNAQSFALTMLVTELTKRLVARRRPFMQSPDCNPDEPETCEGGSGNESFMSGHTSMAFTGAGLVCAHHQRLPLYGGGLADPAACAMAIAAATTVGTLRITADRHYLSDVLVGAALGLFSGYALPSFLHYDIGETDPDTGLPEGGRVTPLATPGGGGIAYEHVWY